MIFTECTENNEVIFNESYITEGFTTIAGSAILTAIIVNKITKSLSKNKYETLSDAIKDIKNKKLNKYSNLTDDDFELKSDEDINDIINDMEKYNKIFERVYSEHVKQIDPKYKNIIELYKTNKTKMKEDIYTYIDTNKKPPINKLIIPGDWLYCDTRPYRGTENEDECINITSELFDNIMNDVNNEIGKNNKYDIKVTWDGGGWDFAISLSYVENLKLKRNKIKKESTVLSFSGNNGGSYMHDTLYESYIQAKIDAEDRLAFALKENMVISEADYSNIRALQEAKISDKIKAKWKKFIAFIKGLVARFMESLSNILLDEKDYLEKYKDIILKKKPKEDMEYSYTGNYTKGINRLINTEVPLFDYYKYKNELEAEGDGALVQKIMSGKQFNYDDGETLAEQFKSYFLALEDGQQEGKFSNLNMTDIYNFCYNFNKIKGIVDKDINRLETSTRAIESAINKELNATGNDAAGDKPENTATNTVEKTEESAIFREAEEKAQTTGLDIKASSDPSSKMASTQNRDDAAEKDSATAGATVAKTNNKEADDITKAANKWIDVCRPLIAAKLTACQQIAKDYMDIIRAHVRSYGGADKKSKEGNKAPDKANKYSKHSDVEKAKADAEKAKKDAEQEKETDTK